MYNVVLAGVQNVYPKWGKEYTSQTGLLATRSIAERRTETTAETGSQTIGKEKERNLVKPTREGRRTQT